MARKSHEQQRYYVAQVRKLMVMQADMPLREMQKQMEKVGVRLDLEYIATLRGKVLRERATRLDRKSQSEALAALEDVMAQAARLNWEIATKPEAPAAARVAALREIRETHALMFSLMQESGVFEKHLGMITVKAGADPATLALVAALRQLWRVPVVYRVPDAPLPALGEKKEDGDA